MRHPASRALLACALAAIAVGHAAQASAQEGVQPQPSYQNMTPEQRAAATRAFLGLGAVPDKAAAARGGPIYLQSCAFCHGPQARGATGASLITSDEVLGDDHGERLVAFLKKGRPEKGMPAFAAMTDAELKDIAEFIHLQVEEVANRGAYHVQNILVGSAANGQAYVAAHCMSCHAADTFAHIGSRYRSPDQLQRNWIWPARPADGSLAITATVKTADGTKFSGRVTQVSDFRITLIDTAGQTHAIDRGPRVEVRFNDPLTPHRELIMSLANDDMRNVTAYLNTLK